jgi:hypothetical protein
MCNCLRLTSIAALLISLQLFSLKIFETKVDVSLPNNISLNQSSITLNSNGSQRLALIAQPNRDFEPIDNGGPENTRGSGTR